MSTAATLELEHHSDRPGAKIGMWLFLYTEILLFAGMFLLYAVYRMKHAQEFHNAAKDLNILIGTLNTLILLTSSLTVAVSIAALERGNKRLCIILLFVTILFGCAFLVNKYFEWGAKFEHGLYPGGEVLENLQQGEILFYGLYFVMTGLHGAHVVVGVIVLAVLLAMVLRNPYERIKFLPHQLRGLNDARLCVMGADGRPLWEGEAAGDALKQISVTLSYDDRAKQKINESDVIKLENGGLYWHLVDIIWIFLFPLFYLIT